MTRRSRQEKYPDTNVFHYYNRNPRNRITSDCVVRAISTGLDIPYNEVVMEMALLQCETGYNDRSPELIDRYLKSKGWIKCKQPRKDNNTKYTGREFCMKLQHPIYCEELNLPDCNWHRMIANIGGHHIIAIVEGMIYDIWDSCEGCIGNVWVKPL